MYYIFKNYALKSSSHIVTWYFEVQCRSWPTFWPSRVDKISLYSVDKELGGGVFYVNSAYSISSTLIMAQKWRKLTILYNIRRCVAYNIENSMLEVMVKYILRHIQGEVYCVWWINFLVCSFYSKEKISLFYYRCYRLSGSRCLYWCKNPNLIQSFMEGDNKNQ